MSFDGRHQGFFRCQYSGLFIRVYFAPCRPAQFSPSRRLARYIRLSCHLLATCIWDGWPSVTPSGTVKDIIVPLISAWIELARDLHCLRSLGRHPLPPTCPVAVPHRRSLAQIRRHPQALPTRRVTPRVAQRTCKDAQGNAIILGKPQSVTTHGGFKRATEIATTLRHARAHRRSRSE